MLMQLHYANIKLCYIMLNLLHYANVNVPLT